MPDASWYRVTLDDRQVAYGKQAHLMGELVRIAAATAIVRGRSPGKEMALFASFRPERAGDTQVYHHYFSPGCLPEARGLIEEYGGVECERPSNENLVDCNI